MSIERGLSTFETQSDLARKNPLRLWSREFITAVTWASWMPAVVLYFGAFCSNKIRLDILRVMDDIDPDAMAKLQAISFGSAVGFSLISLIIKACFSKQVEPVDFNNIPVDVIPFGSNLFKAMDKSHSTPLTVFLKNLAAPAYIQLPFAALNYAVFIAGSLLQGDKTVFDTKFNSIVFRLSMEPSMAIMLNLLAVLISVATLSTFWTVGKVLKRKCCTSADDDGSLFHIQEEGRALRA